MTMRQLISAIKAGLVSTAAYCLAETQAGRDPKLISLLIVFLSAAVIKGSWKHLDVTVERNNSK